ncbi:MAG: hypothetical protein JWN70_4143 [Planctomycetaceae bacterium]|nr:hypothetical protein [Planctomycetaceae bacterium]
MLRRYLSLALIVGASCLPMTVSAQSAGSSVSTTGEILNQIQKLKIKRLAICPRIITRDKDGSNPTFVGPLGPLAERLAVQLRDEVASKSARFNVQIVPDGAVRTALNGVKAGDLYDEAVQSKLRQKTDAIIFLYDNSQEAGSSDEVKIQTEMLDVRQANETTEVVNKTDTAPLSLSDAAYAGQSFVVRAVSDNHIKSVSFKTTPELPEEAAFGVGVDWERVQYAQLIKKDQHPLQEADADNPFKFQVVVGGQPREIWFNPKEGNKAYVALDMDEEFTVQLHNHSTLPVMQALLIDGVNSISQNADIRQEKHHPLETVFARHWITKPVESYYPIDGYLREWNGKVGKAVSKSNRFKVTLASDAEATNAGIDDRFGLLTVIVYAMRDKEYYAEYTGDIPKNLVASRAGGQGFKWGIGAGVQGDTQVEGQTGERGLMLTAMTINYVDSARLQQLKSENPDGTTDGKGDGKDGKDAGKENNDNGKPPIPGTSKKSKVVGEETPF